MSDGSCSLVLQGNSLSESFTYNSPELFSHLDASFSYANTRAVGAESISVFGTMFAYWDTSSFVRLGGTQSQASSWISESTIVCLTSRGISLDHGIAATVALATGTNTNLFSYNSPIVSNVQAANSPAAGSSISTLFGINFGESDYTTKSRIDSKASERSIWTADTSLTAMSPDGDLDGDREGLEIVVTVAMQLDTTSLLFTYDAGLVSSISLTNAPTRSVGSSITLAGLNYAVADSSLLARVGGTSCQDSTWISDTAVSCRVASGASLDQSAQVTVFVDNVQTATSLLTYARPVATAVAGGNGWESASESFPITVSGVNMGDVGYTAQVRGGGTAAEVTVWTSDTSISASLARGSGSTQSVVSSVFLSGPAGTLSNSISFDSPEASSLGGSNVPSTGSVMVSIYGSTFSLHAVSPRARSAETTGESTRWVSDSSIMAMAGSGISEPYKTYVTVGQLVGSVSSTLTFNRQSLSSLQPSNAARSGNESSFIIVAGSGLGMYDFTVHARSGGTDCEHTPWISDSAVTCSLSKGVPFQASDIVISIVQGLDNARGKSLTGAFSYDQIALTHVSYANTIRSGQQGVTFIGQNFGSYDGSTGARIGDTSCIATSWESETSMLCFTPAGSGQGYRVTGTVATHVSTRTESFTYDELSVTASIPSNGPFSGGITSSFQGANYNLLDYSPYARLGGTACTATSWFSDSLIFCKVASGESILHPIVVTIDSQLTTKLNVFTYNGAHVSSITASNLEVASSTVVEVAFSSFTPNDFSLGFRLGFTEVQYSEWVSDTSLSCKASLGYGATLSVSTTVALQVKTTTEVVSYDTAAHPSSVAPSNTPAAGASRITIAANGLALLDVSLSARIDGTAAEMSKWSSDSAIECKISAGIYLRQGEIVISVAQHVGTASDSGITFDQPSVSSVAQITGCTSCNSITIDGENFGFTSYSPQSRLGGDAGACDATEWLSDSGILCKFATFDNHAGLYAGEGVAVTVQGRYSELTGTMTYTEAEVSSLALTNAASISDEQITISGVRLGSGFNFLTGLDLGTADWSPRARLGGTACTSSVWVSDTSLLSLIASSSNGLHDVVVSVAVLVAPATLSDAFTFDFVSISSVLEITGCTSCATVTIEGVNIGYMDFSPAARIGGDGGACEVTEWVSDTAAYCKLAALYSPTGDLTPSGAVLTVEQRLGELTSTFNYTSPDISTVSVTNVGRTGNDVISLFGLRFGAAFNILTAIDIGSADWTNALRAGVSACQSSEWVSDTSVLCAMPAGADATLSVVATVGRADSTLTELLSFDACLPSDSALTNVAGDSPSTLTISGSSFNLFDISPAVKALGTAAEHSAWVSDTTITCGHAAGSGSSLGVTVTAGGTLVGSITQLMSFDQVEPQTAGPTNHETQASSQITITATAVLPFVGTARAALGGTAVELTAWISSTSMTALCGRGIPSCLAVRITAGLRGGTVSDAVSFNLPELDGTLSATNMPESGLQITADGTSFGLFSASTSAQIGGTACARTKWISDTSMFCATAQGTPSSVGVALSAGTQVSGSISFALSYDSVKVSDGTSTNLVTNEPTSVTLHGSFSDASVTAVARTGASACRSTVWASDTALICLPLSAGAQTEGIVSVTSGTRVASVSSVFTYNSAWMSSLASVNNPSPGGAELTIHGAQFSPALYTADARLGGTACQRTSWISETVIQCQVSNGIASTLPAEVTVGVSRGRATITEVFSFDSPAVSS
eukprot:621865-Rhodomonas_salina.3